MRISDWSSDVCSSDLNLKEEFNQLFYETWAGIEENFYDGNFHGVDWKKIRDRYANYLPFLNNRADLRVLLNDMLGELNSSHLGFNTGGSEERKAFSFVTNETVLLFDNVNPYKVDGVIPGSTASLKEVNLRPGGLLGAVDGPQNRK